MIEGSGSIPLGPKHVDPQHWYEGAVIAGSALDPDSKPSADLLQGQKQFRTWPCTIKQFKCHFKISLAQSWSEEWQNYIFVFFSLVHSKVCLTPPQVTGINFLRTMCIFDSCFWANGIWWPRHYNIVKNFCQKIHKNTIFISSKRKKHLAVYKAS